MFIANMFNTFVFIELIICYCVPQILFNQGNERNATRRNLFTYHHGKNEEIHKYLYRSCVHPYSDLRYACYMQNIFHRKFNKFQTKDEKELHNYKSDYVHEMQLKGTNKLCRSLLNIEDTKVQSFNTHNAHSKYFRLIFILISNIYSI